MREDDESDRQSARACAVEVAVLAALTRDELGFRNRGQEHCRSQLRSGPVPSDHDSARTPFASPTSRSNLPIALKVETASGFGRLAECVSTTTPACWTSFSTRALMTSVRCSTLLPPSVHTTATLGPSPVVSETISVAMSSWPVA